MTVVSWAADWPNPICFSQVTLLYQEQKCITETIRTGRKLALMIRFINPKSQSGLFDAMLMSVVEVVKNVESQKSKDAAKQNKTC